MLEVLTPAMAADWLAIVTRAGSCAQGSSMVSRSWPTARGPV
jgi:hypothetical protein